MLTDVRLFNRLSLLILTVFVMVGISSCDNVQEHDAPSLVDPNATEQTRNLYRNLLNNASESVMFGHQATLSYGVKWRSEELPEGEKRSDVKDVAGSYPAIYGWDIADFLRAEYDQEEIEQRIDQSLEWAKFGFERGGILTYCWHKSNPVTGGSFYDTTKAVSDILPGGEFHQDFKDNLDIAADYFNQLNPIPVIFRPWHEHNGDWFWWGKGHAEEDEFIELWQFTVEYLRDEKQVNNLLYAFSPDRSRTDIETFKEDYMYGYPGDEYVDIIGIDNYWDLGHEANETPPDEQFEHFKRSLAYTVEIANEKNKLAALTETGLEAIPDETFWTDRMLEALLTDEKTRQISYFQVWRNANMETDRQDHYYAPYPGQKSAENFIEFREHPFVWFEDELPDMYMSPE